MPADTGKVYPNGNTDWTPKDEKRLVLLVKDGARRNIHLDEVWLKASKLFGRSPQACKQRFDLCVPARARKTIRDNYNAHAKGEFIRPKDRYTLRVQKVIEQSQLSQQPAPEAPKVSDAPIEETMNTKEEPLQPSFSLPVIPEMEIELSPLAKGLAYISTKAMQLESQLAHYKKKCKSQEKEIEKLNMEKETLRAQNAELKKRLAQVVKDK